MLCREIFGVYCKNYRKHINTLWEKNCKVKVVLGLTYETRVGILILATPR